MQMQNQQEIVSAGQRHGIFSLGAPPVGGNQTHSFFNSRSPQLRQAGLQAKGDVGESLRAEAQKIQYGFLRRVFLVQRFDFLRFGMKNDQSHIRGRDSEEQYGNGDARR